MNLCVTCVPFLLATVPQRLQLTLTKPQYRRICHGVNVAPKPTASSRSIVVVSCAPPPQEIQIHTYNGNETSQPRLVKHCLSPKGDAFREPKHGCRQMSDRTGMARDRGSFLVRGRGQ
ncbi:hypothetical protein B0H34DRAFT_141859 [Crassisporium funariophilum]|nr:hypothetical protein B0H34DRAFT_141859 [Crassisporium funariophilum]